MIRNNIIGIRKAISTVKLPFNHLCFLSSISDSSYTYPKQISHCQKWIKRKSKSFLFSFY